MSNGEAFSRTKPALILSATQVPNPDEQTTPSEIYRTVFDYLDWQPNLRQVSRSWKDIYDTHWSPRPSFVLQKPLAFSQLSELQMIVLGSPLTNATYNPEGSVILPFQLYSQRFRFLLRIFAYRFLGVDLEEAGDVLVEHAVLPCWLSVALPLAANEEHAVIEPDRLQALLPTLGLLPASMGIPILKLLRNMLSPETQWPALATLHLNVLFPSAFSPNYFSHVVELVVFSDSGAHGSILLLIERMHTHYARAAFSALLSHACKQRAWPSLCQAIWNFLIDSSYGLEWIRLMLAVCPHPSKETLLKASALPSHDTVELLLDHLPRDTPLHNDVELMGSALASVPRDTAFLFLRHGFCFQRPDVMILASEMFHRWDVVDRCLSNPETAHLYYCRQLLAVAAKCGRKDSTRALLPFVPNSVDLWAALENAASSGRFHVTRQLLDFARSKRWHLPTTRFQRIFLRSLPHTRTVGLLLTTRSASKLVKSRYRDSVKAMLSQSCLDAKSQVVEMFLDHCRLPIPTILSCVDLVDALASAETLETLIQHVVQRLPAEEVYPTLMSLLDSTTSPQAIRIIRSYARLSAPPSSPTLHSRKPKARSTRTPGTKTIRKRRIV